MTKFIMSKHRKKNRAQFVSTGLDTFDFGFIFLFKLDHTIQNVALNTNCALYCCIIMFVKWSLVVRISIRMDHRYILNSCHLYLNCRLKTTLTLLNYNFEVLFPPHAFAGLTWNFWQWHLCPHRMIKLLPRLHLKNKDLAEI